MVNITAKRTEKEYRMLDYDSYSTLKDFADDRRKYYKKYILGKTDDDDDDDNKALTMGRLVETLLLEGEEEFDNKFYKSSISKSPTGNNLTFVNALYKRTIESVDEDGTVNKDFIQLCQEAYVDAAISKPGFDVFMKGTEKTKGFIGSETEIYYRQMRESRPMKKIVISLQDYDNAQNIVKELRENELTGPIFNQETDDRWEVFNQLQVEGYSLYSDEVEKSIEDEGKLAPRFKSMYDKIIVDHKLKTIQFYDLKCTWNVEEFYEAYYLYRRSYIQAYLYNFALVMRRVDLGFDYSKGYTIHLPKFIVVDSINNMKPLIYELTSTDLLDAAMGFTHKNKYYKGVVEIAEELAWAKQNDEWRISRANALTGGLVKFKK